jgi:B12-binding domain/radical SAM domain protein
LPSAKRSKANKRAAGSDRLPELRISAGKKRSVAFRVFSGNRLTLPLLLNIWEREGLGKHFDIVLLEGEPGRLTAEQAVALQASDACVYSFMTPHLPSIAGEIGALRASGQRTPLLVAGGPHVSGEPELAAACGFDILFGGEGEDAFLRFGQDLLAGKLKAGGGSPDFLAPEIPDAGTGKNRGWERFIPVSRYFRTLPPLEISRGCFWKCRYCQTSGPRPRNRGDDSIALYLDELRRRDLPRVGFISPSALEFGATRRGRPDLERIGRLLELCRQRGFRFIEFGIFPSEVRPDTVSAEALALLSRYVANKRLTIGAQSALDASLQAIGRGHGIAAVERAVALANEAGFVVNLDFIIALPGETAGDRRQLLEFIAGMRKKHRVFIQLHHFFPLAGSVFAYREPSFLSAGERREFASLKRNGLASDWWLEGERSAHAYLAWLKHDFPKFFARFG